MPIWNDHGAQIDFCAWLEQHQQERREQEIRDLAKRYAEGRDMPSQNRVVTPMINQTNPTTTWLSPNASKPMASLNFRYNDIVLDIHPGIQGFPRQLLAEMAIREQLDLCDEPGDN
jgi:hypothetical protein